jgi:carbonic anhydrase/acetyltransferase-like protein (isoleucine patch superfamily)
MPIYAIDGTEPVFADRASNWIAPDATLIGNISIGRDVSVWFGAVLRGDNERIEIGEGSNVQEHTIMHTDPGFPLTIGRGCTIGHRALLHGCTVGENSLIGMGAIVLNGAVVGRGSLVAAGAVVLEGTAVPPDSLVAGVPAKVKRPVTDAERERIRSGAASYVSRSATYRDESRSP